MLINVSASIAVLGSGVAVEGMTDARAIWPLEKSVLRVRCIGIVGTNITLAANGVFQLAAVCVRARLPKLELHDVAILVNGLTVSICFGCLDSNRLVCISHTQNALWAMPCGETESGDDTTNLQRVGSVASTPRIEPKLGLSGTVSTVVMQPTQTL